MGFFFLVGGGLVWVLLVGVGIEVEGLCGMKRDCTSCPQAGLSFECIEGGDLKMNGTKESMRIPGWCLSADLRYADLISSAVASFSMPSTLYGSTFGGSSSTSSRSMSFLDLRGILIDIRMVRGRWIMIRSCCLTGDVWETRRNFLACRVA